MSTLAQFGISLTSLAAIGAVAAPFVSKWIDARIGAGVDEAVKRRLAALQLDLDKDLERHRTDLGIAAEHIRSSLARSSSDFAIYAQRRHDAVAQLFSEMLAAEYLINDRSNLRNPSDDNDERESPESRVIRARNDAYQSYIRHALYLPDELDEVAIKARNSFHDLVTEYVAPSNTPSTSKGRARDAVRTAMAELQHAARAELSRSRPN